jgi:hypothetical protein
MTPHELETRDEMREGQGNLSTVDLAAVTESHGAVLLPEKPSQDANVPLFAQNDTQDFRSRWDRIQNGFVDEPREAVEQADELVAGTIKRLAEVFASERQKLEANWDKTDRVSTEDLRVALRRYRSFFDRLLSV